MTVSKYSDIVINKVFNSSNSIEVPTKSKLFINYNIVVQGSNTSYIIAQIDYINIPGNYYYGSLMLSNKTQSSVTFVNQYWVNGANVSEKNSATVSSTAIVSSYNLGIAIDYTGTSISFYINGTLIHTLYSTSYGIPLTKYNIIQMNGANSSWSTTNTNKFTQNIFPNECPYGVPSGYKTLGELMSDGKATMNNSEELYWYK